MVAQCFSRVAVQGISQSAQAITWREYFSLIVRDSGVQLVPQELLFAHVSQCGQTSPTFCNQNISEFFEKHLNCSLGR